MYKHWKRCNRLCRFYVYFNIKNSLSEARNACGKTLEAYRQCLYKTHNDFSDCRKPQKEFYDCWSKHVTESQN